MTNDLSWMPETTISFHDKKIYVGATFEGVSYPCSATFAEILTGYTAAQKAALRDFFTRAVRMALNNGVVPDTAIVDGDIEISLNDE